MGTPNVGPTPTEATDTITKGYLDTNGVQSTTIRLVVTLTQAAYDALGTKDANTLYIIVP